MPGLIAHGRSDRAVGVKLSIAQSTAHEYLENAKRKLKARTRAEAVALAVSLGIIAPWPHRFTGRKRQATTRKGAGTRRQCGVRRGMIQLAWRFLRFQKDSVLAQWFRTRAADGRSGTRKTMIVALARKLLVALWRMVKTGEIPEGVILRPAA